MFDFLGNLRLLDHQSFFALYNFASQNHFWHDFFYLFAQYGIILIFLGIIYLVLRIRIDAVFSAMMAMVFSAIISFVIYYFWQRPRPYVTYAAVQQLASYTTSYSFPSAHTFLSFAIAMTIWLYGHKKLGAALFLVAATIAVSRVAAGVHYPSDVIAGAAIGIISGTLAHWFMESFEHFWGENSAE
ncbi:MAG: phosphatase PAP2 family protein [Candidatus Berkelbacteria bacterium]|nr:phosphatase PAP2 family protein [Candidatus Berkelbacteria bacterium]